MAYDLLQLVTQGAERKAEGGSDGIAPVMQKAKTVTCGKIKSQSSLDSRRIISIVRSSVTLSRVISRFSPSYPGLVTAVLCTVQRSLEHGIPRRSFLSRRAIDGTRGRKYFDPSEDESFDSYGSAGGQYDPYDHITDLSDIRKNVPGEPGIDYPAYTRLPQTGFTCEGRSRGYYADEAAGCQVFHVCHDVLVSSFLCPIGSTFSQKLLTCDWWTKVDCSATRRYFQVNRDSYQIDDDEMIRNAYAMISLQASAEAVTKDGLVDPDSGARIIDYSVLDGRTVMGYTPMGIRRITDYPAVEATGNDLPSGFEDYPQQDARQILNYDHRYQQKKANVAYQGKPHFMENKGRSPYHASAIIQHDYQDRSGDNEFQDDYRRPDGLTNRLQTSYAPTVPTVTTTTRRFYSPTVPTTYRPSTLAYSTQDLMVDSSDHLYAHSKGPVTPPTITHRNDDTSKIDLRESETGHGDPKKSESASSSATNKDDRKGDDVRSKNDEARFGETSETNFRINVTDAIDEDDVFRQQNDRPVIQIDSEGSLEDIEARDSIGLARALNNPLGRIIMRNQNPTYQVSKAERTSSTTPVPLQTVLNRSSGPYEKADGANLSGAPKKPGVFNETSNDQSTEDYEGISSSTARSLDGGTTPLLKHWEQRDVAQLSTVPMTATPAINTTERSVDEINDEIAVRSSSNDSSAAEDQSSSPTGSISNFDGESVHKINLSLEVPQPAQFLKPPVERFLINVPEESRYTTNNENSKTSWNSETTTTEIPRLFSTLARNEGQSPIYDEELIDYTDEGFAETPNSGVHSTVRVVTEVSTSIPWLVPTWHGRSIVDVPVTDIVPPIVDYNDGFGDFVPPNEYSYAEQFDHTEPADSARRAEDSPTTSKRNDSEADILARYNTGFQFTIRDAIKTQKGSKASSRCRSSIFEQGGRCETSSVTPKVAVTTPSVTERTVSIGTKATARTPEVSFSSSTRKLKLPEESVTLVPGRSSTSAAESSINSNINVEDSNLKTVTPRGALEIKDPEEATERTVTTTASSLSHSIHPESLKQIEEAIDKHESPYEVSFTVKKDEDLETTADDFISRLIAQHQRPDSVLKDELDDYDIVKSVEPEPEISILQTPKFSVANHAFPDNANNGSFYVAENDTASEFKQSDSNMSMVSLLQLMAELLKLDRLPRPFSAKDLSNIEPRDSFNLDLDETSYDTTSPPFAQTRATYKNANSRASTFATSKTPAKLAESKVSRNIQLSKASFVTGSPRLDHSQAITPFGNADSKIPSLGDALKTPNIDLKPSLDASSTVSSNNITEQKTGRSIPESKVARPRQKEEILERLTENLGQPLYHGESIRRSLVFDLPQVQRSLDFETGLPIEESEQATSETEEESSISTTTAMTTTSQITTTTTESARTTVETEFVPSLGFSLDTNEGREEYVQAVLGGLIDEHTSESGRNESSIAQNEASKNETLEAEQ
ncbi:PREDICTED: probable GPI-anchored adhesin-like protein PGA55 [Vollenhovia emeryi]|uniref:probable GPI-anchored adhesin-like protein PGA55 n=1 Tax=Vollenhovia emeryi TaxID=411798 RepID=UPI0005F39CA9|nr:PREDICTED: probable GPI-anchored adhesin-like protein PGA55 [Vollenhovia emeryi]